MNHTFKLKKIRDALLKVHDNVNHYIADDTSDDYIVWGEDGSGETLFANNAISEQVITGTVELFTKTEYNELVDAIQDVMCELSISFVLEAVQYEEETNMIHYSWRFEI